jgi:putative endopeptidase
MPKKTKTHKGKKNKSKTKKSFLGSIVNFLKPYNETQENDTENKPCNKDEIQTSYYKGFQKEYKQIPYAKLKHKLMDVFKVLGHSGEKFNPKDDFYSYVNELWLQNFKVKKDQKYIIEIDDFRLVQDKVYHELLDIVKKTIKTENSESIQLKNLYYSVKNGASISLFKTQVNELVTKIDLLRKDETNLWKLLGGLNKNDSISYACPFYFALNPDDKHSNIYRSYIESPVVTLVDTTVYFDVGINIEYKNNYRKAYFRYLKKLFRTAFGKNNINVKDVFDVERDILYAIGCNYNAISESSINYYKVTTKEALKYGFDWTQFASELGFTYTPDFFITSNLNYLKCGTKLVIDNWRSDKWRTYWIYILLRDVVRLTSEYSNIYYDFMGDFISGSEANIDRSIMPIFPIIYAYNTLLSNKYNEIHHNKESIEYVKNMSNDLKEVFLKTISSNKWLQPETKKYALLKLKHLKFIIGSDVQSIEDPELYFDITNPFDNMRKIGEWRHEKIINLEGKELVDFPLIDWSQVPPKLTGTESYIVNAFYRMNKNSIFIPLGYIQKPFIDLEERGIEYNLAHIGFTLAHEMSHSLDDLGSQYNYKGNLDNWWTNSDKKHYKKIQENIIKQYETSAKSDGIVYDAEIGIGENLADISGLNICNRYLAEFQEKNDDVYSVRELSFKIFYVYYAYQMRQKISKKAIKAQTVANPHPPDKYRTNIPLSRLDLFQQIYDVKKGDGMYCPPNSEIW